VQRWDDHYQALEFTEARLDCIEGLTLIGDWRERLSDAPDEWMDSLATLMADNWEEVLGICSDEATLGELRDARGLFLEAQPIIDRITARLAELEG